MTLLLAICVVVIFSVAIYLMLSRELKSVAMGVFIFSHAAHLGILAMSGQPLLKINGELELKGPPILGSAEYVADPLPQALILTSIVISFAVMAFLLTLLVVTYRRTQTLSVRQLAQEDRQEGPNLA
ncbi:MAG: NADH-quinone oxidoreductase subunit K [Planctomycetota bacterium]